MIAAISLSHRCMVLLVLVSALVGCDLPVSDPANPVEYPPLLPIDEILAQADQPPLR